MSDLLRNLKIGPTPSPPSGREIIENIRTVHRQVQALDPKNWVWNYTPYIAADQSIVMNEEFTDDGKRHIFLHPTHKAAVDEFLASVSDEPV